MASLRYESLPQSIADCPVSGNSPRGDQDYGQSMQGNTVSGYRNSLTHGVVFQKPHFTPHFGLSAAVG
jgi:hypothetical protein